MNKQEKWLSEVVKTLSNLSVGSLNNMFGLASIPPTLSPNCDEVFREYCFLRGGGGGEGVVASSYIHSQSDIMFSLNIFTSSIAPARP